MGGNAVRPYTLTAVGLLPAAALLGALAGPPRAEGQQAPAPVVVTSGTPQETRARPGDASSRGRWAPQVIATARPANEVVPVAAAVQAPPPPLKSAPPTLGTPIKDPPVLPSLGPTPASPPPPATPSAPGANLVVEKVAPTVVVLGKPLSYEIVVRNRGSASAHGVRVEEALPPGARWVGGEPRPEARGAALLWDLGTLAAGAETRLKLQVDPSAEGVYSSVATVSTSTTCVLRTQVTPPAPAPKVVNPPIAIADPGSPARPAERPAPGLAVSVTGSPAAARVGEAVSFRIEVVNHGVAKPRRLIVRVHLPAGLRHPAGDAIEAEVPGPAPGDRATLPLTATAVAVGRQVVEAAASAEGIDEVKALYAVTVGEPPALAPAALPARLHDVSPLALPTPGPGGMLPPVSPSLAARSPLPESPAEVKQTGGAPARPRQMPSLVEPAGRKEVFARDAGGGLAPMPALTVEVVCQDDPLEVGAETTYEIRVANQGAAAARDLQVSASLPDGLALLSAEGPGQRYINGPQVAFEPAAQLDARGRVVYRVRAKGLRAGDWRFKVYVRCAQFARPEYKEVSTRVYSDREPDKASRKEGNKR